MKTNKKYLINIIFTVMLLFLMLLSACSDNNNITETDNFNSIDDVLQINNDETTTKEYVYSPPTELGNDLTSFNIEIEDDLYRLPAPISAFIDNGWEITEKAVETLEAGVFKTYAVSLTKNNKTLLDLDLTNYSNESKPIEECFVYGITAKKYSLFSESEDISIILPGGVTIGIAESEVTNTYKSLFENDKLKTRIDNEDYTLYEYLGIYNRTIQIYISKETSLVYNIQIQNLEKQ